MINEESLWTTDSLHYHLYAMQYGCSMEQRMYLAINRSKGPEATVSLRLRNSSITGIEFLWAEPILRSTIIISICIPSI